MFDHRFGSNLPFLNKKVKTEQVAFPLASARFDEQSGRTQILHPRDVAAIGRFPIDPEVARYRNTRSAPAGGAGRNLHRAHRVHPRPLDLRARLPFAAPPEGQGKRLCQSARRPSTESLSNRFYEETERPARTVGPSGNTARFDGRCTLARPSRKQFSGKGVCRSDPCRSDLEPLREVRPARSSVPVERCTEKESVPPECRAWQSFRCESNRDSCVRGLRS
jgi:hypothetical protein